MSHECDDCGQAFDTLSRLRLHDCSPSNSTTDTDTGSELSPPAESNNTSANYGPEPIEIDELDQQLAAANSGDMAALTQAVATYESALASEDETGSNTRYRRISRTYQEPLITALDEATQTEGWEFLTDFLEAYHPETTADFPHVTTILQNVTGRYFIRTRLSEGVDKVPGDGIDFFSSILQKVGEEGYDFINEGLHPYGWGIGHPDHSVSEDIHQHASTSIFVVNPMLEHAFYADQQLAIELLEDIIDDEAIAMTIPHHSGEISEARFLLDAPAGAVSDFSPTIPRYWDWEKKLNYKFELSEDVEQRILDIVRRNGIEQELPSDWEVSDLTL